MTATDCPTDATSAPAKRRRKAWQKPRAWRANRNTIAGRRQRQAELCLCQQLGTQYSRLTVVTKAQVDSAVVAMTQIELAKLAQSRGEPIDDAMAQRWAGILSRALEALGLSNGGQTPAQREAVRLRQLEEDREAGLIR